MLLLTILLIGISLVIIQGWFAYEDGFLLQWQLKSRSIHGYSFMEHGGMWSDVFIISPMIAYILSRYRLRTDLLITWVILLIIVGFVLSMGVYFSNAARHMPEAHSHNGRTTVAGWIHGLFATIGLWVSVLFYLGLTKPISSKKDFLIFAFILTPFFFLGTVKFSPSWRFDTFAKTQTVLCTAILWLVVWLRWSHLPV